MRPCLQPGPLRLAHEACPTPDPGPHHAHARRDAGSGLPPVLQHFLTNCQALHAVCVLIHVRHVPVSHVLPRERLVVQPLPGFPG